MESAEWNACPACRSSEVAETLRVPEVMLLRGEAFDYHLCAGCGSAWIASVPENLAGYYGPQYERFDSGEGRFRTAFQRWSKGHVVRAIVGPGSWIGSLLRRFSRYPVYRLLEVVGGELLGPGRRILDVGCGSGELLRLLQLAGDREVLGLDAFLAAGAELAGVEVRRCEVTALTEGGWDTVMFHHSLEHLPDPVGALRAARGLLAPGGSVLVRVPTVDSEAFEIYREHWVGLEAPRHLCVFSRQGLTRCASDAGFRVARQTDDIEIGWFFWGSEQVRRGIGMADDRSLAVGLGDGTFSPDEIAAWDARARELAKQGRGSQTVVVLEPA